MKTKTINLYEFKELEPTIKEKVIERFREEEDFSLLEEDLNIKLEELLIEHQINHISDLKLYYDLSYTQGSGCCFEGTFEKEGIIYKIKHKGMYNHYNSKEITALKEDTEEEIDTEAFNLEYISICKGLEKYGYNCIEDTLREENIIETIEANEYYFRENGKIEGI